MLNVTQVAETKFSYSCLSCCTISSLLRNYISTFSHDAFYPFLYSTLSESCSLLGTDNVPGQIFKHVFSRNARCVYYSSSIFCNMHSFEN